MQEQERTLDLTCLSARYLWGRAFAIFSWDDVSCQVGHAEPMMRAPGPLKIARVDEGPALTQQIAPFNGLTNVDLQSD